MACANSGEVGGRSPGLPPKDEAEAVLVRPWIGEAKAAGRKAAAAGDGLSRFGDCRPGARACARWDWTHGDVDPMGR